MLTSPLQPILRSPLSFPLNRIVSGFFPSRLFASGEQGAWYDPSDRATLFQDSAGTTPVTAVEQPVGLILDKSKGLVLGQEYVTNASDRDFSADTGFWSKEGSATISGGVVNINNPSGTAAIYKFNFPNTLGGYVEISFDLVLSAGAVEVIYGSATSRAFTASGRVRVRMYRSAVGTFGIRATGGSTALGTIDNISIRELPGNHAFQATTTSRPVLSARVNLLTASERFDDAAWVKTGPTASTYQGTGSQAVVTANYGVAPNGEQTADRVQLNLNGGTTNSDRSGFAQLATGFPAIVYAYSLHIKSLTGTSSASVAQALSTNINTAGSAVIVNLPDGWVRATWTAASAFAPADVRVQITGTSGLNSADFLIWGASIVPANQASLPYQRVNTSTDYDADQAKFPVYLRFDGVDDWLQTNSIDFTATDKMTVFAGVRKLSDAALGCVAELSSVVPIAGSFSLFAPRNAGGLNYGFENRGTLSSAALSASAFTAPITNVLTGIGDISGDSVILRVNGTQAASSTADQGTGNFGNYPLYIGRRGGTSLPFNGQLYSLIVRGAQTSTTQIAQTERWVAGKTGVTL